MEKVGEEVGSRKTTEKERKKGMNNNRIEQENLRNKIAQQYDMLEGVEDVSLREECVKHFDLGRGRRQAVMFAEPVHYRDDRGNRQRPAADHGQRTSGVSQCL